MTTEKVIDILKGIKYGTACLMPNMPEDGEKAIDIAIKAVEQSEPHWIPVTEGLPKKCNTTYLATVDYGEHGMAVGQRFFFGDNIGWNDKSVVAWCELPEPYKGVTE